MRLRLFEFGGILPPVAQNAHRGQVIPRPHPALGIPGGVEERVPLPRIERASGVANGRKHLLQAQEDSARAGTCRRQQGRQAREQFGGGGVAEGSAAREGIPGLVR